MSSFDYTQHADPQPVGQVTPHAAGLPFDFSRGQPIAALAVSDNEALAVMTVGQLLALVPDPRKSEDPKEVAHDPTLAQYAQVRREVQRAVQGAKAKNAI